MGELLHGNSGMSLDSLKERYFLKGGPQIDCLGGLTAIWMAHKQQALGRDSSCWCCSSIHIRMKRRMSRDSSSSSSKYLLRQTPHMCCCLQGGVDLERKELKMMAPRDSLVPEATTKLVQLKDSSSSSSSSSSSNSSSNMNSSSITHQTDSSNSRILSYTSGNSSSCSSNIRSRKDSSSNSSTSSSTSSSRASTAAGGSYPIGDTSNDEFFEF